MKKLCVIDARSESRPMLYKLVHFLPIILLMLSNAACPIILYRENSENPLKHDNPSEEMKPDSTFERTPEKDIPDDSILTINEAHSFWADYLVYTKDGKSIYSSDARQIKKWDTKTGKMLSAGNDEKYVLRSLNLSPDEKYIVTAGEEIELRSPDDCKIIKTSSFYKDKKGISPNSANFTPDGKYIVGADQEAIRLFTVMDLKPFSIIEELPQEYINVITFNSEGTIMACCGYENNIRLYDARSWKPIKIIENLQDHPTCLVFSPNDEYLAASLWDGEIIMFSLDPLTVKYNYFGEEKVIQSIAFSPDGKLLASGGTQFTENMLYIGPSVKIWSVETGDLLHEYKGHGTFITVVTFNPDGKILVSAGGSKSGAGGCIKFWSVNNVYNKK